MEKLTGHVSGSYVLLCFFFFRLCLSGFLSFIFSVARYPFSLFVKLKLDYLFLRFHEASIGLESVGTSRTESNKECSDVISRSRGPRGQRGAWRMEVGRVS